MRSLSVVALPFALVATLLPGVQSWPFKKKVDSDGDGLSDKEELKLGKD